MDMSNIKTIFDNNVQKNVKKITDANGNILWYKVPDGYRKVEYIHGDGEQYINTGYSANANIEILAKYKSDLIAYPATSNTRCILGGRDDAANGVSIWDRNGYFQFGQQSGSIYVVSAALQNTNIHSIRIKSGVLWVDGKYVANINVGNSWGTNPVIYLFTCCSASGTYARTSDNTDKRTMIGQFYYCIIKDNDVIVRHLIPVVRNIDDKPGMYDLVNDVFYTNAGTGEFTWGEISNG